MTKKTSNHSHSLKIPKVIILTSKFIAFISTKLATLFAAKIFTTPIKHKVPKRELEMEHNSIQKFLKIPALNTQIVLYEYGESPKKILLVHGWSGRGTQLFKIADALLKSGYSTISFDAPAHGKSEGKTTNMVDFIASILEINKQLGPFEAAIGHSLGGMSVINATKGDLKTNHIVLIGSGDIVQDILDNFVAKIGLDSSISKKLRLHFENKYGEDMNNYSAYKAASETNIPVLVIHDKNDMEVPVDAAIHIHKYLKNGTLFLTENLGHRKILGNQKVIEKVVEFIEKKVGDINASL